MKEPNNVQYMLSSIKFGAPLHIDGVRYNDITDREREQTLKVSEFQKRIVKMIEEFKQKNEGGVDPIIFSQAVGQIEFDKLVKSDVAYAVFSVMFVQAYFVFHLRSFFLATIGVILIIFSFPLTSIICEGVLRITYYSNLHNMVIFIVLGIAADDIFVFIDAWRQSAAIKLY